MKEYTRFTHNMLIIIKFIKCIWFYLFFCYYYILLILNFVYIFFYYYRYFYVFCHYNFFYKDFEEEKILKKINGSDLGFDVYDGPEEEIIYCDSEEETLYSDFDFFFDYTFDYTYPFGYTNTFLELDNKCSRLRTFHYRYSYVYKNILLSGSHVNYRRKIRVSRKVESKSRADVWRAFYYKFFNLHQLRGLDLSWKFFLNTDPFNPRKNFFGLRGRNVNYLGRSWRYDGFFHIRRRYRLPYRWYYKGFMAQHFFWSFFKKDNFYFYFFYKMRLFNFFFKVDFFKVKKFFFWSNYFYTFFLKNWVRLKLLSRINFWVNSYLKLKKFYLLEVKKLKGFFVNAWAFTYHAVNLQLNNEIQSGVYIAYPSIDLLRFPNPWFRTFNFTKLYLGYLILC